jgi:hypothetical protein
MSRAIKLLTAGLGLAVAACSSDDVPTAARPGRTAGPGVVAAYQPAAGADRARHERLARRVARALSDPAFRQAVLAAISVSPIREGKVHLQAFLDGGNGLERRRVARLAAEPETELARDLGESPALELYFPVAEHRRRWGGGAGQLVATATADRDSPVAYDPMGRRYVLDPDTPPDTPVLMVAPAEARFEAGPLPLTCTEECGGGLSGGSGEGAAVPGLYLTRTQFEQTFESWFKGDPEFEIHVLGNDGATTRLKTYQCAGEHAGGAYAFDQNSTGWSGSVLLFSQAQLDQYHQLHAGQSVRVLVVEDDDTACEIKVDSTRATNLFAAVDALYSGYAGGKDTAIALVRHFRKASMWRRLLTALASWIKSNDELVGNAVDDPFAAAAFFSGANWVVRGDNTVATGALRLEMK